MKNHRCLDKLRLIDNEKSNRIATYSFVLRNIITQNIFCPYNQYFIFVSPRAKSSNAERMWRSLGPRKKNLFSVCSWRYFLNNLKRKVQWSGNNDKSKKRCTNLNSYFYLIPICTIEIIAFLKIKFLSICHIERDGWLLMA